MNIYARQGDLVIEKLTNPIMGELKRMAGLVLAGSHTSPHMISGSVEARQDGRIWFVRVSADTNIVHGSRHLPIVMKAGDYSIRPLRERGDFSDRAVED